MDTILKSGLQNDREHTVLGNSMADTCLFWSLTGLISSSVNAGGQDISTATQCIIDRFSVTNPGGNAPPTICGSNTGQHSEFWTF